MKDIVLASSNKGKLKEFQQLFSKYQINVVPQSHFDVVDAVEDGLSFIENAIIKARHAAKQTGLAALSDDSGLSVDALNGQPGICSARFSGENATDKTNNEKLLKLLENTQEQDRTASFHCVLAFVRHWQDPTPIICHGIWQGKILTEPVGSQGFGYDPIFFADDQQCASAELTPEVKNKVSHRGQAVTQLTQKLNHLFC